MKKVVVLMYHRIDTPKNEVMQFSDVYEYKKMVVSSEQLYSDIQSLLSAGWRHVPIEDCKLPLEHSFHLTFDDGYVEHYNVVLPILAEFRISSASFSINSSLIDGNLIPLPLDVIYFLLARGRYSDIDRLLQTNMSSEFSNYIHQIKEHINKMLPSQIQEMCQKLHLTTGEKKYINAQYMNLKQIKSLLSEGQKICSHGVTHRDLRCHNVETMNELLSSKIALERILGSKIETFCFPDGSYNPEIISECLRLGYKNLIGISSRSALIVDRFFSNKNSNLSLFLET